MSYERLAYVYDFLMSDVPYDQWIEFLNQQRKLYEQEGLQLLDLACGTGELSVRLAKQGYSVTGVDLSEDMLYVANEKAEREEVHIQLFQQDMSSLEGLGLFDTIIIFCDSLNYLKTPEDVKKTFEHVHRHLHDDGLFLFDVHSPFQMEHVFNDQTFTLVDEEVSYIWNCYRGDHPLSVEHELTFFVQEDKSGKYERFDELHKQRSYIMKEYEKWLKEAGFEILSITADFTDKAPNDTSKRLFFTTKKKK